MVFTSAAALLTMGLLATLVVVSATQTEYGRTHVRNYLQRTIARNVHGRMYIGAIGGGMLTGVTIDSIEIRGPDDSLFVATGRVTVTYDPRDLIDKRVLLSRLEIEHPVVRIKKEVDGEWNYRHIFPRGPKRPPRRDRGLGDFIVISDAVVHDAAFTLVMPWAPDAHLKGARADSAIAFNLERPDHDIRREGAGFMRGWHWRRGEIRSNYVRLSDPDSAGRLFSLTALAVAGDDPPLAFRNVRGVVRQLGDSVWLDLPHFDLPASTGRASGKIVWGSDLPVRYAVHVVGDSVSMNDVAWVYATLPRTGGGRMDLDIRNQPGRLNVIDYAISKMDMRTTGSRLLGSMTYGVGDAVLMLTNVKVEAAPVDFALIRALNGKPFPFPWAGQISGTVQARGGPLDRFVVDDARFTFRDANVRGATTIGSASGGLDILSPAYTAFHGLDVQVDQLDLRTLQYLNPNFPRVNGFVSGTATLDSSWLDVRFRDADLTHLDGPGEASHLTGSGRVTWGARFLTYDLDLDARPLAVGTLARSYPAIPVRGSFRGPLRVRGTMENLDLATVLTGAAGTMAVSGNFDLYPAGYRARARGSLTNVDVRALLDRRDVPVTNLTTRFDADIAGDSLSNLAGTVAVETDRSLVDGIRLYPSVIRLGFADGRMQVDSLQVETSAATLSATGGLGLSASRADTLSFRVRVDSLGGLRRYLAASRIEDRAGSDDVALETVVDDSLGGSLTIDGALTGSVDTLRAAGEVRGRDLLMGSSRARALHGRFALDDVLSAPRGTASMSLDTLVAGTVRLDSASVDLQLLAPGEARFAARAASQSGPHAALGGAVHSTLDSTVVTLDSLAIVTSLGQWGLVTRATAVETDAGLWLDSLVLRGSQSGRIAMRGAMPTTLPVAITISADSVPLADIGELAQADVPYVGLASLDWRIAGTRAQPTMAIDAALADARFGSMTIESATARGTYANRRLDADLSLLRGGRTALRATGSLPLDLALLPVSKRALPDSLRVNVRSDSVDLAIVESFSPTLRRARGTVSANVDVAGTWTAPRMSGALRVAGGAVDLTTLGIHAERIFADVDFAGDSIHVRRFSVMSGDQRADTISLTGAVNLADYANPRFDLHLYARNFHAMNKPRVADLELSTSRPGLRLRGSVNGSELTGDLAVTRGEIYIPELAQKRVISLDDPEFYRVVDTSLTTNRTLLPTAPPRLVKNLTLQQVRIGMGDDVWLRSAEANIKLGGEVSVTVGRPSGGADSARTQLALEGVLTADRGTYRLSLPAVQRTFVIEEQGTLRFFGDPDLNPTLDIRAIHTVRQFSQQDVRQDIKIQVRITGTLARPVLELTSPDQRLSQSDLISYLVTGAPSFAVGGINESATLAANIVLPSIGSYLSTRFGGRAVDVVQLSTAGTGQEAVRLQDFGGTVLSSFTAARLGVGKQLTDRTFVSANAGLCQIGQFLGQGNGGASPTLKPQDFAESVGLKVEHRLNSGFSLSFGSEPATSALLCNQTSARGFVATPRQYGFDLFKTWQF